jgi:hypothetical protein
MERGADHRARPRRFSGVRFVAARSLDLLQ